VVPLSSKRVPRKGKTTKRATREVLATANREMETSSGSASRAGEVMAIAEAPQIADPAAVR